MSTLMFHMVSDTLTGMTSDGQRIAARREHLGMTQSELADAAGVSARTIHNLERDKTWPQKPNRNRVEHALGWAPGSLEQIRDGGDPTPLSAKLSDGIFPHTIEEHLAHTEQQHSPAGVSKTVSDLGKQGHSAATIHPDRAIAAVQGALRAVGSTGSDHVPAPTRVLAAIVLDDIVAQLDDEHREQLALYAFQLLDRQQAVTLAHPPNRADESATSSDSSRRDGGPSASVSGGESRKEFHTDRMSEEERRELAATDEVWGDYVESKRVRPESEL